jgi:ribonuclease HI
MSVNSKQIIQIIPKKQSMVRWEPPPVNWLKINVDGSFVPSTGSASVGAVIRDHCGYAIAGARRVLEKCTSAEEAEALALLEGARLAAGWTRAPIIFENDCATVVSALQKDSSSLSSLGTIFKDFKMFASVLPDWKCVLAKRNQNYVAHEAAAYVRRMGVGADWSCLYPDEIAKDIAFDCNYEYLCCQ